MAAGAGSTGGILAVCIAKFRKVFKASGLNPFQKDKGEIKWQQARGETSSPRKVISQ
jgi:hypothetical protein